MSYRHVTKYVIGVTLLAYCLAVVVIAGRWLGQVDLTSSSTAGLAYLFAPMWATFAALPFALLAYTVASVFRAGLTRQRKHVISALLGSVLAIAYVVFSWVEISHEHKLVNLVEEIKALDDAGLTTFLDSDPYRNNRDALAAVAINPNASGATLARIAGTDDLQLHESLTWKASTATGSDSRSFILHLVLRGWRTRWGAPYPPHIENIQKARYGISVMQLILRHPNVDAQTLALISRSPNPEIQTDLENKRSNTLQRSDCIFNFKRRSGLAYETCLAAAESGDKLSQWQLGEVYQSRWSAEKNQEKAFYWMEKAAKQGVVGAQKSLAGMYWSGTGVTKDSGKACYWYKQASNDPDYDIGLCLKKANYKYVKPRASVKECLNHYKSRQYDKAFTTCMTAAKLDNLQAQYLLANMYQLGLGLNKNGEQAMYWYKSSADSGYRWSQFELAQLYRTGNAGIQDSRKAVEYYQLAAEQGHAEAQMSLGVMYFQGDGTKINMEKARYWWEKADKNGIARAKDALKMIPR